VTQQQSEIKPSSESVRTMIRSNPEVSAMATMSKLEQEYEEFCLKDLAESKRLGYNPSYFLRMLEEYGAVETTRRLINSDKWPEGFTRLSEIGRLDLTLEAGIYDNPKFQALFDEKTLANCRARLVEVEYIKEEKP
jgi:hypothetical protein